MRNVLFFPVSSFTHISQALMNCLISIVWTPQVKRLRQPPRTVRAGCRDARNFSPNSAGSRPWRFGSVTEISFPLRGSSEELIAARRESIPSCNCRWLWA